MTAGQGGSGRPGISDLAPLTLGKKGRPGSPDAERVLEKPSHELSRFSGGVLGEVSAQKPRLAQPRHCLSGGNLWSL